MTVFLTCRFFRLASHEPFLIQKTSGTMVYISADGSVDGSRSRSRNPFKLLTDLFLGLFNGILLFFRTISTPPERLPEVSLCCVRAGGGTDW